MASKGTAFSSTVIFFNVFSILKLLSFERSFHLRKGKDAVKKTGIVLTSLDGALA
jgi:hypothetical protein